MARIATHSTCESHHRLDVRELARSGLLNGTVVMETVFSVPGLGLYLIQSIIVRDYTVTQALVFFFAAIFIVINLLVDIMYGWLDPRISRQ